MTDHYFISGPTEAMNYPEAAMNLEPQQIEHEMFINNYYDSHQPVQQAQQPYIVPLASQRAVVASPQGPTGPMSAHVELKYVH